MKQLVALVDSPDHVCVRYRLTAFRPAMAAAGWQLDLVPLLRSVGLMIEADRSDSTPFIGITTRESGDSAVVATVATGSPAEAAGLYASDELVALDGFRVESSGLKARLRERRVGERVTLTVFRRDQLRTVELKLAERPLDQYEVKPVADPTAAEGAAFERWMGAPLSVLAKPQSEDENEDKE